MSDRWTRYTLTAELLSDAHIGCGAGSGDIDALVARDRYGRPVIWASHVEGVLRDAARRLRGDQEAQGFFGRPGGDYQRRDRQRTVFTSLYTKDSPDSHVWRSAARQAFDNRAPQDDTLRVIEFVPKGTRFVGEVELPVDELPILQWLVQEVDGLGGGRASGSGRVKLSLTEANVKPRAVGDPKERLLVLLKNRDPLCITATATPDNLIPSLSFIPGRALLGSLAAWLIEEGDLETASLLTSGRISVSDAIPLPEAPTELETVEVLPAPLSLQSRKPKGSAGEVPWWAAPNMPAERLDALETEEKLKRPEDDLFVYRPGPADRWTACRPARRVRLRNGRPDPQQLKASLFAIEQIVEETHFIAELRGSLEDIEKLAEKLAPVLSGCRWLRLGRSGAPVEVADLGWCDPPPSPRVNDRALLILTSDLLVRDEFLRWRTSLDEAALKELVGRDDVEIVKTADGVAKTIQDSVMVHGFNGTSRLWRMPAAAIRRGSVFVISGTGLATLADRAAKGQWLGERTHEGFGRFRLDTVLPGMTDGRHTNREIAPRPDDPEESIAEQTRKWFEECKALARTDGERKPSLSQWMDLVSDLERGDMQAIDSRLQPVTAGARGWKHKDAKNVLNKLKGLQPDQRAAYARFFVRWLRAELRANRDREVQ